MIYDFYNPIPPNPLRGQYAVDRFLININLGPPPACRTRQTYYGIYNISSFDLSFSITCSDGPDCNESYNPVPDLYSCDNVGRKICKNVSCDPTTNCQVCSTSTFEQSLSITSPSIERNLNGNSMSYNIVQCKTQHNAMQCNAVHFTIQSNAMQYSTVQYSTVQCNTM